MDKPNITIYTDGACTGNPGVGGYGIVLISGEHRKEVSEGFKLTTNNRMELLAVIVGLEMLRKEGSNVTVYTDSKYVSEAINQNWIKDWVKKGFKKVKNPDLWRRFLEIYKKHNVEFIWVKGHSDNIENNRCDFLARQATKSNTLSIDENYENPSDEQAKLEF
ncbi:MAG: ribonuclease HI [Bacteroidales bacterium]|jgi:ribonuclease HI|nr:ribonuclease HI [Bacteroidales bacterium]MCK9499251.1 ribonuclease HI [Bacteroidales bacterium]MDY0314543.1 ribonuclease HI [Bacteroidales bacterium]NLB85782.1 ribonuclease HI [Bacteroidales bacterium]